MVMDMELYLKITELTGKDYNGRECGVMEDKVFVTQTDKIIEDLVEAMEKLREEK